MTGYIEQVLYTAIYTLNYSAVRTSNWSCDWLAFLKCHDNTSVIILKLIYNILIMPKIAKVPKMIIICYHHCYYCSIIHKWIVINLVISYSFKSPSNMNTNAITYLMLVLACKYMEYVIICMHFHNRYLLVHPLWLFHCT